LPRFWVIRVEPFLNVAVIRRSGGGLDQVPVIAVQILEDRNDAMGLEPWRNDEAQAAV